MRTATDMLRYIVTVATDFDGTLWDGRSPLHRDVRAALDDLAADGHHVVVATSRREPVLRDLFARLGLDLPTVMLDGALACTQGFGRRVYQAAIPTGQLEQILNTCTEFRLRPVHFTDHPTRDVVIPEGATTTPRHLRHLAAHRREDPSGTVLGLAVLHEQVERLQHCARALMRRGVATAYVTPAPRLGGAALTISHPKTDKRVAVDAWRDALDRAETPIVAVGDGPNDLPLLSSADLAIGVVSADTRVRAVCHHLVPTPIDGGWHAVPELVRGFVTNGGRPAVDRGGEHVVDAGYG